MLVLISDLHFVDGSAEEQLSLPGYGVFFR